jgi:predicted nucleic acid-binding protein
MYLLDTNVVSELRPGKRDPAPAPRQWAASVHLDEQFISVVTLYELELGVLSMERRDPAQGAPLRTWLTQLRALFSPRLLPITERISVACAALQVPDRMPEMDALIAATALKHGLTLVTRNVGDFVGRGVSLLNPWSP